MKKLGYDKYKLKVFAVYLLVLVSFPFPVSKLARLLSSTLCTWRGPTFSFPFTIQICQLLSLTLRYSFCWWYFECRSFVSTSVKVGSKIRLQAKGLIFWLRMISIWFSFPFWLLKQKKSTLGNALYGDLYHIVHMPKVCMLKHLFDQDWSNGASCWSYKWRDRTSSETKKGHWITHFGFFSPIPKRSQKWWCCDVGPWHTNITVHCTQQHCDGQWQIIRHIQQFM